MFHCGCVHLNTTENSEFLGEPLLLFPLKEDEEVRLREWTEPLFAEAKDWHGMRRFRLRLLWRVNSEALRIAAGQNLKRLLKKRGWGRRPFPAEAVFALF
jgi:hypothetical protein